MVTMNVCAFAFFTLLGAIGAAAVIKLIIDDMINDWFDISFASFLGIVSLAALITMPGCIWYGLTTDVDFVMKNSEGKVIEKTVKPFEFNHNGNCFSFADDDDNVYCGWEVKYTYRD